MKRLSTSVLWFHLFISGLIGSAGAASYYISSRGDDSATGTSVTSAWRTAQRATLGPAGGYQPGDSILFEGRQNFGGALVISTANYSPSSANPLLISSYGQDRATLTGGLILATVSGVRVASLIFVGPGMSSQASGIVVINQASATVSGFEFSNLDIGGYTNAVYLLPGAPPLRKYRDLRFDRLKVHGNAAGLTLLGSLPGPGTGAVQNNNFYAIENLYIGNSEFFGNTGGGLGDHGYAIALIQCDNVTIERNNIHDNGGNAPSPPGQENGPGAITVYDGRRVTIQYNEVSKQYLTRGSEADNPFLDIWALDSFVQYNYVHDIESWGITFQAGNPASPTDVFPWPSERMTVRYNIFYNIGRYNHPIVGPMQFYTFLMNGPIKDFEIYNNTFYTEPLAGTPRERLEPFILITHGDPTYPGWNNLRFRNNIFSSNGGNLPFLYAFPLIGTLQFQGNNYFGSTGPNLISWGGQNYSDVAAWSQATGQERVNDQFVARQEDPKYCGLLPTATANSFKLQSASPMINRGLDLRALFNINMGTRDFFGNSLPADNLDIGANEFVSGQSCGDSFGGAPPVSDTSKILASPNPLGADDGGTTIYNLPANEDLEIFNQLGQRVRRFDAAGTVFWDGKNDQGEEVASGIYTGVVDGKGMFKIGVVR